MSADEYLALGETPEHYELIDGVIFMSPSPFPAHNELALEIAFQFKAEIRNGVRARVFTETDVTFGTHVVYRPDVVVYNPSRLPAGRIDRLTLPPDLVVEVLSPSTKAYDLVTKRDDYQRHGVSEYWAIDSADASVRCWQRHPARAAAFSEVPIDSTVLNSLAMPGLKLDIAALRNIGRGMG